MYVQDYDGAYPSWQCRCAWLWTVHVFAQFPNRPAQLCKPPNYTADAGQVWAHHNDGANLLFADGHAKWVPANGISCNNPNAIITLKSFWPQDGSTLTHWRM